MANSDPVLTNEHYYLFGRITHCYALVEQHFKAAIGGMLDMNPLTFYVISAPYSSSNLKDVAKSIGKLNLDPKMSDEFVSLIGDFKSHGKIRNHIAHNPWANGTRPNSIRPIHVDIRNGKAVPKGFGTEEPDYTIDELVKTADNLAELNSKLFTFIENSGILDTIDKKISSTKTDNDSALGEP